MEFPESLSYSSLSSIAPSTFFRQHPMSVESWYMRILFGRPILTYPCVHGHKRTLLMSFFFRFSSNVNYVFFVLLGRLVKYEISCCTAVVLLGVSSRFIEACTHHSCIVSNLLFLCISMLWVITITSKLIQLGRNPVLFSRRSVFHMLDNLLMSIFAVSKRILTTFRWWNAVADIREPVY